MKTAEKAIEKAAKACAEISAAYNVPVSSIVWAGNTRFIIVNNGEQFTIEWED